MKLAAFVAAVGVIVATGASAQVTTRAANEAAVQASVEDPDERTICKREPPPIGSRVGGRKICKTESEWQRLAEAHQNDIRDYQDKASAWDTRP
ncbi:MAG: hypothetical protein WA906_04020 [Pacificimonas sp.]